MDEIISDGEREFVTRVGGRNRRELRAPVSKVVGFSANTGRWVVKTPAGLKRVSTFETGSIAIGSIAVRQTDESISFVN